ncbi:MAG: GntR family transcriptional regulator [Anaerolineales bacterium]|nr:GntR family transcriptional regulator [Anaerolineales bacterium]MDW8161237.1 GntR family transcriptional regulator [Anaerolineales bacterium]
MTDVPKALSFESRKLPENYSIRHNEPLRYQVRKAILDFLEKENYAIGDKIPSEQELMELLNVSRSTLREGLQMLEQERILITKHGLGRYLASAPKDLKFDITELLSVTEMLANYGIQVKTHLLSLETLPADQRLAHLLDLLIGESVIAIERIRHADAIPVIYSIEYIPAKKLPGPIDPKELEGSLFALLENRWGIKLDYSIATLRAVVSEGHIPSVAAADPHLPWVLLEQVNYTEQGEPIVFSCDYHRSDYIEFHLKRYRR